MRIRRSAISFLVAVVAALSVVACSDEIPSAPSEGAGDEDVVALLGANAEEFQYEIGEHGGTLTFATISEPLTFNLALANDASSSGVLGYLFEGLTDISWLTGEPQPNLAEAWDVSADGLTWTFYLRDDVVWHDGEPFTAADVEFSFNQIIYNEDIPTSDRAAFTFRLLDNNGEWQEAPMTVTAIDDHTVRCVLPVSFAPFLRSMSQSIFPQHILQPYIDEGTFAAVWDIDTDPSEIVGTGPFVISGYTPGERIEFERFDEYWMTDAEGNRLPYLDRVIQIIVPDLEAELEAFLNGEADLHGVLGAEYAQLEALQEEQDFTIHRRGPTFGSTFLTFNMNRGRTPTQAIPISPQRSSIGSQTSSSARRLRSASTRLRSSSRCSTDSGILSGRRSVRQPARSTIPMLPHMSTTSTARMRCLTSWAGPTAMETASARTTAATRSPSRSPLNTQNSVREQVGSIIREGMTELGIKVDFQLIEFGELVGQLTVSYDWDAIVIGFTAGPDPYSGIVIWHSSESLHLWYPNQSEPATEWEAELDDLYIRASQELDREQRIALYHRAQEIVAENLPVIYTSHAERLNAVRNVFGNTTPTLYGLWDTRYLYRMDN